MKLFIFFLFSQIYSPQEILNIVDRNTYDFKNIHYTMEIRTEGEKGVEGEMKIEVWQSGDQKRLIKFIEPSSALGMAILVLKANEIYVYLPEYHRTRKVASHTRRQTFMGTEVSYDDLSIQKYEEQFDPVEVKDEGENYLLVLKKKKDAEIGYNRLDLIVKKDIMEVVKIFYYDEFEGEPIKTETRSGWIEKKGRITPTRVEFFNKKTNKKTVIEFKEIEFDVELSKNFFSKDTLSSEKMR